MVAKSIVEYIYDAVRGIHKEPKAFIVTHKEWCETGILISFQDN